MWNCKCMNLARNVPVIFGCLFSRFRGLLRRFRETVVVVRQLVRLHGALFAEVVTLLARFAVPDVDATATSAGFGAVIIVGNAINRTSFCWLLSMVDASSKMLESLLPVEQFKLSLVASISIFSWWPLVRSSNDSSSHDDADEWPASTSSNDKSSTLFTAVCLFCCSERASNKSMNDEVWYWRRLLGDRIWRSASLWRMCAARLSVYISGISFIGGTRSHRNNLVSSSGLPRTKSKPQRWLAAIWCLASSSWANLIETKNDWIRFEFCTAYRIMEIFYIFLVFHCTAFGWLRSLRRIQTPFIDKCVKTFMARH